jgi:pyruvate formate lyase activating enzyme
MLTGSSIHTPVATKHACPGTIIGQTGSVHSWDIFTGVDGPGTRVVLFLPGCPMRCSYCQNPDTWLRHDGVEMSLSELEVLMRRYKPFISTAGGGFTVSGGGPLQQSKFTEELIEAARAGQVGAPRT